MAVKSDFNNTTTAQPPKPGALPEAVAIAGLAGERSLSAVADWTEEKRAAVEKELIKTIENLLERGADINDKSDNTGSTALIYAAELGYAEVAHFLIGRGAELEEQDGDIGLTALGWAYGSGHVGIMRQLIEAGAAITVTNKNNVKLCPPLWEVRVAADEMLQEAPEIRQQALDRQKTRVTHTTAAAQQDMLKADARKFTLKPAPAARRP